MPRIDQRAQARPAPDIGSLREIAWVCTTVERPDLGGPSTIVERPGVIKVHARVRPLKGTQVLDWKAVLGSEQAPTHEITIRMPPDVSVQLNHWVFCEDRYSKSWYRIRTVEDMGGVRRFLLLLCSLETFNDARHDPATQKPPPVFEVPEGSDVVESI
jgi:hypothetical protein